MTTNDDWKLSPKIINEIDINKTTITHVAFLDENGDSNMKHIIHSKLNKIDVDENSKYFAVTSVLCKLNDLVNIKNSFIDIKNEFWPKNGKFLYSGNNEMKVCFHSKEIRDRKGPFSDNCINYDNFILKLSSLMESLPILINSCFINKELHYLNYGLEAQSPYEIALTFILERILTKILKDSDELILVLEARGKNEDRIVLQHLMFLINNGTYYHTSRQFKKIKGIYFNKKRSKDNSLSYYGLESADLCAHPIYRYCITNFKNRALISIEPKIHGYPYYFGRGVKIFPIKR